MRYLLRVLLPSRLTMYPILDATRIGIACMSKLGMVGTSSLYMDWQSVGKVSK